MKLAKMARMKIRVVFIGSDMGISNVKRRSFKKEKVEVREHLGSLCWLRELETGCQ